MRKAKLYLFIGYPGAGKTTIAKLISEATGARHIWADVERHKLYPNPTHSKEESDKLYDQLNEATDYLLSQGKSVVFDTSFNHYADRQKLRKIAQKNNADTVVIWVDTPIKTSRERALSGHRVRNNYATVMSEGQFEAISSKLEEPKASEKVIKIDGTNIDKQRVLGKIKG